MASSRASISQEAFRRAQPLTVYFELTYRCNWRCLFCYNPRHSDIRPLTFQDWSGVLDDLRELGTLNVNLTGGEPLAHPQFLEIAQGARARAFAVRILTNGTLIDARMAKAIRDLQPIAVEMSLHGATAEVHDRTTAVAGSFGRLLQAVDLLKAEGVRMALKTPVTNMNEHELPAMRSLAQELEIQWKVDTAITPRDDGDPSPLAYAPSAEAIRAATKLAIESGTLDDQDRTRTMSNCGIGRMTMAIDPEGNVYPCIQWRRSSLGNVRETPLLRMWRESEERERAAAIGVAANTKLREMGGAAARLSFCPALAEQQTGDPLQPDKGFLARAKAVDSLRNGASDD
jgi:MoaA/NifB/PqqE/SkfB family radical SAM enzyme